MNPNYREHIRGNMKLLALFGCLAILGAALRAQPADLTDLSRAVVGVRLVSRAPVQPRLPVLMEVTVTNPTATELKLPAPTLATKEGPNNTLDLYYAHNGGAPQRIRFVVPDFSPWKEGIVPAAPAFRAFRPREVWSTTIPVSFDWQGEPKPIVEIGSLQISARLCAVVQRGGGLIVDRDLGVNSAVLVIEVREPAGNEKAALDDVRKLDRSWLLATPESATYLMDSPVETSIRGFSRKHPSTLYGRHAAVAEARFIIANRTSSQQDLSLAAQYLNEALADPRFVLQDIVRELKAELASRPPQRSKPQ